MTIPVAFVTIEFLTYYDNHASCPAYSSSVVWHRHCTQPDCRRTDPAHSFYATSRETGCQGGERACGSPDRPAHGRNGELIPVSDFWLRSNDHLDGVGGSGYFGKGASAAPMGFHVG